MAAAATTSKSATSTKSQVSPLCLPGTFNRMTNNNKVWKDNKNLFSKQTGCSFSLLYFLLDKIFNFNCNWWFSQPSQSHTGRSVFHFMYICMYMCLFLVLDNRTMGKQCDGSAHWIREQSEEIRGRAIKPDCLPRSNCNYIQTYILTDAPFVCSLPPRKFQTSQATTTNSCTCMTIE